MPSPHSSHPTRRNPMSFSVAVLMDPIGAIKIAKDSTFAMLL